MESKPSASASCATRVIVSYASTGSEMPTRSMRQPCGTIKPNFIAMRTLLSNKEKGVNLKCFHYITSHGSKWSQGGTCIKLAQPVQRTAPASPRPTSHLYAPHCIGSYPSNRISYIPCVQPTSEKKWHSHCFPYALADAPIMYSSSSAQFLDG